MSMTSPYLASGDYAKELLATAAAAGVAMFEEDERLLCYPSLVRVLPGDAAVEVDRVRDRKVRPSVLIAALAAAQQRAPRFRPGRPMWRSVKAWTLSARPAELARLGLLPYIVVGSRH